MKKRGIKILSVMLTIILTLSMFNVSAFAESTKLATPKISITAYTTPALKISWSAISGANSYYVYRCKAGESSMKLIKKTTKLYYKDKDVEKDVVYSYRVRAYTVTGGKKVSKSALSNTVKKAVANIGSPTNVKAKVVSDSEIKLSWDKVVGAEKYYVYSSTTKNGSYKLLGSTKNTSYNVKKLTSSTTYYFKVKAAKTLDSSSYSSEYSNVVSCKTKSKAGEFIVDFEKITNKEAGLPTGSAITCATMLLKHYGAKVTTEELLPYFKCSTETYYEDGYLFGPNLDYCFFGDPKTNNTYAYGASYECVCRACLEYTRATKQTKAFDMCFEVWNDNPDSLKPFLKDGNICLVRIYAKPRTDYLDIAYKGGSYRFFDKRWSNEKYVILCGYTNDGYIVYDPANGKYEEYKQYVDGVFLFQAFIALNK